MVKSAQKAEEVEVQAQPEVKEAPQAV